MTGFQTASNASTGFRRHQMLRRVSDGIKCFDGLQTASPTLRRHSHKNRNLKFRHSRAGGNPVCSVSVVFWFRVISKSSFPLRRESRPWDSGNIQRLSENSEVLDSRFRGNDEKLRTAGGMTRFQTALSTCFDMAANSSTPNSDPE